MMGQQNGHEWDNEIYNNFTKLGIIIVKTFRPIEAENANTFLSSRYIVFNDSRRVSYLGPIKNSHKILVVLVRCTSNFLK